DDEEQEDAGANFDENDGEEPPPDNIEGWVDEIEELFAEDRQNLDAHRAPVKLVLFKLRTFSCKVINSTIKLLPAWYRAVKKSKLKAKLLPRDVPTRWNSHTDLLETAV
ncbi:hypothetical protein BDN72DRAFT_744599, partial [Pluteus cervinus]